MKRILFFALLAVGLIGGYLYFSRAQPSASSLNGQPIPALAPKETIDAARAKAKKIEKDSQRQADDLLKKTE